MGNEIKHPEYDEFSEKIETSDFRFGIKFYYVLFMVIILMAITVISIIYKD